VEIVRMVGERKIIHMVIMMVFGKTENDMATVYLIGMILENT